MAEHTKPNPVGYRVLPVAPARRLVIDSGRLGIQRHIIHGLLEFDVTQPREYFREHKTRTGETLSFTAFVISCFAQAIAQNPLVQAKMNWRNQLIVFHDVDVMLTIETEVDATAMLHVVRGANHKSFRQIHDEIRTIQAQPSRSEQKSWLTDLGPYFPGFARDMFYRALKLSPQWQRKFGGTVIVTAVGMFGSGGGWGFGFLPMHTLGLTVGGIGVKPTFVDGQCVPHEFLCLTISLDHDVVDGAAAARFSQCLKVLIESGNGLSSEE